MSYQSPITMYTERIIKDIDEKQDEYLVEEVRKVGFNINKEELAKALEYDRDQYMRGYTDGRMYTPSVITNADRIRSMTDEELAWAYAYHLASCYGCEASTIEDCVKCMLDWLKQEEKER